MRTEIAKKIKEKTQSSNERRLTTNSIIKFLKKHKIDYREFYKEYIRMYKSDLKEPTFRYKLNSATFTEEELNNCKTLIKAIQEDLKQIINQNGQTSK